MTEFHIEMTKGQPGQSDSCYQTELLQHNGGRYLTGALFPRVTDKLLLQSLTRQLITARGYTYYISD